MSESSGERPTTALEARRTFCVRGCHAVSALSAAWLFSACGGTSPAAPSSPPAGGNPPPGPNPPGPNPPAPPDPGPQPPNPSPPNPNPPTPPPEPGPLVSLPVVSGTLSSGALIVRVDAASPLASTGGAALTQIVVGGITRFFLLARLTADTFSALNAVCTHEGCTVSRFASPLFVCPCHGSR